MLTPPAAPPGYTVVAHEIRSRNPAGGGSIAVFAGTAGGLAEAARLLAKATATQAPDDAWSLRLAAVCWWIDRPLEECVSGREREVSVYDVEAGQWGEWHPEERVSQTTMGRHKAGCRVERKTV